MPDKKKIIETIKANKKELEEKYGFITIYLFGSFATDSANETSDIDIAVEANNSYKTWDNFLNAKDDLKSKLGQDIDLVYIDSMNPIIKDEASKDFIKIE